MPNFFSLFSSKAQMGKNLIKLSAERAETLVIIERKFRGNVDGGFG